MSETLITSSSAQFSSQPEAPISIVAQATEPAIEFIEPGLLNSIPAENKRGVGKVLTCAKRVGQTALVTAEITPGINEAVRGALFVGSEFLSHSNPLMAGAVAGLSTFAIEAAGGAAGISLRGTPQAEWITTKTNLALEKARVPAVLSRSTKLWFTFLGGTNVGMLMEQRENPDRTRAQESRYNMITSAWLGGTLAVAGALSAEGINIGMDNPQVTGGVTGVVGLAAAGRWLKKRFTKSETSRSEALTDFNKKYSIKFAITSNEQKLAEAAQLEQSVWYEKGYGSLEEYKEHIDGSITITAFKDDKCIGLARMFEGTTRVMPFLKLDFFDPQVKADVTARARAGKTVEMGTLAKAEDAPQGIVMKGILRMFYREAIKNGVEEMACIMEPERVEKINKRYGLTYRQVGPAINYQGGYCAPHVMNIDEADRNMRVKHPLIYLWFVKKHLNK